MLDVVYKGREQGLGKEELLLNLAQVEGLYVPRFYTPQYDADGNFTGMEHDCRVPAIVKRRWVRDLDKYPNTSAILTSETSEYVYCRSGQRLRASLPFLHGRVLFPQAACKKLRIAFR